MLTLKRLLPPIGLLGILALCGSLGAIAAQTGGGIPRGMMGLITICGVVSLCLVCQYFLFVGSRD